MIKTLVTAGLLALSLSTPSLARDCTMADHYTAEAKVSQYINPQTNWAKVSDKEIGDMHYYLKNQLLPWSETIKDQCYQHSVFNQLAYTYAAVSEEMNNFDRQKRLGLSRVNKIPNFDPKKKYKHDDKKFTIDNSSAYTNYGVTTITSIRIKCDNNGADCIYIMN